jgi:Na+-translocating ferredoxin:NAD+ oxidoreductase RnfG subunit
MSDIYPLALNDTAKKIVAEVCKKRYFSIEFREKEFTVTDVLTGSDENVVYTDSKKQKEYEEAFSDIINSGYVVSVKDVTVINAMRKQLMGLSDWVGNQVYDTPSEGIAKLEKLLKPQR